jgi:glycerol-3-phosphate acyltransferase PlsY
VEVGFAAAIGLVIIVRHRTNLARLRSGEEPVVRPRTP